LRDDSSTTSIDRPAGYPRAHERSISLRRRMRRPPTDKIRALVASWLVLDFFGDSRKGRGGGGGSTLTTTIFSQSFLSFVVAALLWPEPPPVPYAAAMLSLSSLLTALGALDVETGLPRRRADRVLLGTAPIGPFATTMARALHGAFRTLLLTIGMALPPAILLACRQHRAWLAPGYLAAACLCAALTNGVLAVLLLAARRFLGAPRTALFAGTLKALLLGFGVVLFVLGLPALQRDADALPIGRLGAQLLPTYHAAELLADPGAQAWRLLPLLSAGALLLLLGRWLGEQERETADRVVGIGLPGRALLAAARSAPERGLAAFVAVQIWRSPGLRAHALPLLGIPAAIAFLALRGADSSARAMFVAMALQFPGIYLPFVIAFLPRSDDPGASWLFASAPAIEPALVQRATWLALVAQVLLPVHLVAWAVLALAGAPPLCVLGDGAFALGAAALLAPAMLRNLPSIPFTRDEAGEAGFELGNLMAFGLLLAGAGAAFAQASTLVRNAVLSLLGLVLVIRLRAQPRARTGATAEDPPPARGGPPHGHQGNTLSGAKPTLRRELAAIGFLYGVVALLPLAIGLLFGPAS
jgi:hypothetical protein